MGEGERGKMALKDEIQKRSEGASNIDKIFILLCLLFYRKKKERGVKKNM